MVKVDIQSIKSEILRLRKVMLAFGPLYLTLREPIEEYVFGKSGVAYHGFYNPSTVMDLVISNYQRGSKPISAKPTNAVSGVIKYGLNAQKLPSYISGFRSPDLETGEFEIIQYSKDYSLGITFDRNSKKPQRIYECEYESGKIKRIILCMFLDLYQDDELGNFFKIEIENYEYRQNELFWTFHIMDGMLQSPRSLSATITIDPEGVFKTLTRDGVESSIRPKRKITDFHYCG